MLGRVRPIDRDIGVLLTSPAKALISTEGRNTHNFLTDLVPNWCAEAGKGDQLMLDGKRYYAHFPDEDPANDPSLLHTPALIAALGALEKELRPFIPTRRLMINSRPKR
jgi:hypothetical protein